MTNVSPPLLKKVKAEELAAVLKESTETRGITLYCFRVNEARLLVTPCVEMQQLPLRSELFLIFLCHYSYLKSRV